MSDVHSNTSSERPTLIAGIDVGLHTSLALLDLDGNIVYLDSFYSPRNCDLLRLITSHGTIAILSTDRAKPPARAKKIASALSAGLILPVRNMTKKKKRLLIRDFLEEKLSLDSHQRAALASAIFAFRRLRPGLKKMRDRLEKRGGIGRYEYLRDMYVLKNFTSKNQNEILQ